MEPLFDAVYFGVPNMMPRSDAELFADLPNRGGSGLEVYEPDHTCLSGEEVGIYYYDTDRTVYFADFTWVEPEEEEERQVEVSALTKQQKDELVCTYAALMLHDGELEISEEKLKKVITASGNSVEGYWPGLFAKALKGKNIADMLQNAGAAAAPAGGAPAAAAAEAPVADKKAEKKKEEEEEADMDMGGLFGDDY